MKFDAAMIRDNSRTRPHWGRPSHLVDLLKNVSENQGFVTFINEDGHLVRQKVSSLFLTAQRILGGLRSMGLKPGDAVIFQLDQHHFIPAFWGCLLGGFLPLPMKVAEDGDKRLAAKLHYAWETLGLPPVLTCRNLIAEVHEAFELHGETKVRLVTVEMLEEHGPDEVFHACGENDSAFLLMAQGEGGFPTLVCFDHKSALRRVKDLYGNVDGGGFLYWSPFEDVCGVLSIFPRERSFYLASDAVFKNPLIWLDLVDRYRIAGAEMSDLMMSLLLDELGASKYKGWDLSCLDQVLIGLDVPASQIMRQFSDCLAVKGLKAGVLRAVFMLPEVGPVCGHSDFSAQDFRSGSSLELGTPVSDHHIRVVDEKGRVAADGAAGRIQIKGPGVAQGYYLGVGHLQIPLTDGGWFETQKKGFLCNGRLTLTPDAFSDGRSACLEIEEIVGAVPGVEKGFTAACKINEIHGGPGDVVVFFHTHHEEKDKLSSLLKEINEAIFKNVGVRPRFLAPLDRDAFPGDNCRLKRQLLLLRWKAGEFDHIVKNVGNLMVGDSACRMSRTG